MIIFVIYGMLCWIGIALALFGWLLPLIAGILRYYWGLGGHVLIRIGVSWCVLVLAWMIWWSEWKNRDLSIILSFGGRWAAIMAALLGWLIPLIWGVRRCRCGKDGDVLMGIGAIWGALALWTIIENFKMVFPF